MIPDFTADGLLPRGRFVCAQEEFEKRFVAAPEFATSTSRSKIYEDLQMFIALMKRKKLPIPALFVGGTYVTSKLDPGDIDVAFLVDRSSNPTGPILNQITALTQKARKREPMGSQKRVFQIDAFVVFWDAQGNESMIDKQYLRDRGKWDDFWQRVVIKSERQNPVREHAMPKTGYLEVIVDGYR